MLKPSVRLSEPVAGFGKGRRGLTFTANVSGGDNDVTPTYNWSVSAGTISSGQGTSTIIVDTKEAGGMTVTATVDVGGYSRECSTSHSCTASVAKKSLKVAEYGKVKPAEEKAILDKFAAELESTRPRKATSSLTRRPKALRWKRSRLPTRPCNTLSSNATLVRAGFCPQPADTANRLRLNSGSYRQAQTCRKQPRRLIRAK